MSSKPVVTKALKVSLIVGTTLNLINQGEILFALDVTHLHLTKIFLTYLVPYSVTTYTAVTLKLEFQIGTKAIESVDLICPKHKEVIHVEQDEIIPECSQCGLKTHWRLK